MAELFQQTTINSMILSNRFVRSATWEGLAGINGEATHELIDRQVALARGGVGLIITGHTYVSEEGKAGSWQLGIHSDELIPGLERMAEAVHLEGAKIVLQLAHAGCRAAVQLTQKTPVGPSEGLQDFNIPSCREMVQSDFEQVCMAFANGAYRAKKAGFDGVQIHAAHGYLLSQFLCPVINRRVDQYGGNIVNRARLVKDVYEAIRNAVGNRYPVMIKMNSEDFIDNGLTVDEMLEVAKILEEVGIDAIELSGGTFYSSPYLPSRTAKITCEAEEVYYRDAAVRYKKTIRTPLMLVGGIRSYNVSEQLIREGVADYISLCRPLIREPGLIGRWQSGDRCGTGCLSDNACFKPAFKGKGLYCVTKENQHRKVDKAVM